MGSPTDIGLLAEAPRTHDLPEALSVALPRLPTTTNSPEVVDCENLLCDSLTADGVLRCRP